jgi:hypothetical protein
LDLIVTSLSIFITKLAQLTVNVTEALRRCLLLVITIGFLIREDPGISKGCLTYIVSAVLAITLVVAAALMVGWESHDSVVGVSEASVQSRMAVLAFRTLFQMDERRI